jgi:hypothetical protein
MKLGIRVMKPILKLSAFLLSIVLVLFISCKKELSCKNCETNQPPIANAGTDQIITSPKDSVTLDAAHLLILMAQSLLINGKSF